MVGFSPRQGDKHIPTDRIVQSDTASNRTDTSMTDRHGASSRQEVLSPRTDRTSQETPVVASVSADIIPVNLSNRHIINTIMNHSQDTLYFKDRECRFILNSRSHAHLFKVENPEELYGKSDADFFPPDTASTKYEVEQEIMRTGRPRIGQIEKWELPDGSAIWETTSKYPLYNDKGDIVGTWGTSRYITAIKNAEQELDRVNKALALANTKLRELSIIDELSGLNNRRNFYDTLHRTVKKYARLRNRGQDATFSLILLDIDSFKLINDKYGHPFGDQAIWSIGKTLALHTRTSDYAFRYGGDEFAIILPDTDAAGGKELAERLRVMIENNVMHFEGEEIRLTVSMGVTAYDEQMDDATEMVQTADARLYEAKEKGRNCVC